MRASPLGAAGRARIRDLQEAEARAHEAAWADGQRYPDGRRPSRSDQYVPASRRAATVIVLVALVSAIQVLSPVVIALSLGDLVRTGSVETLGGAIVTLASLGLLYGIATIGAGVAWVCWFDRVWRNAVPLTGRAAAGSRTRIWLVWLIPVLGYVLAPRYVVAAYRLLGGPDRRWRSLPYLWAVAFAGAQVVRLVLELEAPADALTSATAFADLLAAGLVSGLATALAGCLAITLVLEMERQQRVRLRGPAGDVGPEVRRRGAPACSGTSTAR